MCVGVQATAIDSSYTQVLEIILRILKFRFERKPKTTFHLLLLNIVSVSIGKFLGLINSSYMTSYLS